MVIHSSGLRAGELERGLPCDELLPQASLVIDRATTVPATPDDVWPWLVQIGKDRSGWYFPRWVERCIPPSHRGGRGLDPAFQDLAVGDRVLDWGPGRPVLEVVVVEPGRDLGFRSTRGRTSLTWELALSPEGATASRLHLRLRIDRRQDRFTPVLVWLGGSFDWLTVVGLFAGLRDRLAP